MTDFMAWMAMWSGGALGVLVFVNWALSERQKTWINDRFIDLFIWLDDQRELKYLRHLRQFRWQVIVVILYAALALLMVLVMAYGILSGEAARTETPRGLVHAMLGGYLGSFMATLFMARTAQPYVLDWVTKTEGSWSYIGRSTLALLAILPVTIVLAATYLIADWAMYPATASYDEYLGQRHPFYLLVGGAVMMFATTVALLVLTSWLLVVIPVVVVLVIMSVFRVGQFVAARIAENPKGPIIGLSGLLTAIGAVAKLFI